MRIVSFAACLVAAGALAAACYQPNTPDRAFRCSVNLGNACPGGFVCNAEGLCVHPETPDMLRTSLDLSGDQATTPFGRSCDERVVAGAFSNLTPLTAANTTADEEHLALDNSSTAPRLLFQRGNQLFAAAFQGHDPKSIAAPQAITLTGGPNGALSGGTVTTDGTYWFSGTNAGVVGLYAAAPTDATSFSVAAPRQPAGGSCAFADPFFMQGKATLEMYASFQLGAGCSGGAYIVRGALDRDIGAFYAAIPDAGWAAPSMTPSGLTLIVSSTTNGRHLYVASRSDTPYQFTTTVLLPMDAIGAGTEDRHAVVSADCSTIYFSSVRSGGAGGADLYAADIAAE